MATHSYGRSLGELFDKLSTLLFTTLSDAQEVVLRASETTTGNRTPFAKIKNYDTFIGKMEAIYTAKNDRLLNRLARLPIFESSRSAWSPGDTKANNNIAHILIRAVNPLLRDNYGFYPCRIVITDAMNYKRQCGVFRPEDRVIHIGKRHYNGDFNEFFNTYIHEQMHCLQHDMMNHFRNFRRHYFSDDEAYLIQYWIIEEPNYVNPALYERLGREVHSRFVADAVSYGY